ncbi:hypothetical protein D3C80_1367690 [compost metagenome]
MICVDMSGRSLARRPRCSRRLLAHWSRSLNWLCGVSSGGCSVPAAASFCVRRARTSSCPRSCSNWSTFCSVVCSVGAGLAGGGSSCAGRLAAPSTKTAMAAAIDRKRQGRVVIGPLHTIQADAAHRASVPVASLPPQRPRRNVAASCHPPGGAGNPPRAIH